MSEGEVEAGELWRPRRAVPKLVIVLRIMPNGALRDLGKAVATMKRRRRITTCAFRSQVEKSLR